MAPITLACGNVRCKQGKKKSEISADFSVFGGSGKKNPWKKSTEKISAKNRRKIEKFRHFPEKFRFFPKKSDFFPKFGINYILGH